MMTKIELRAAVERFIADRGKVVSERLLCELAGISTDTLRMVFKTKATSLTPTTQIRLEKALKAVERGEVKVLERPLDRSRHVVYRKTPEPEFRRGYGLTVRDGKIAIRAAPVNPNCYTRKTFREELEG